MAKPKYPFVDLGELPVDLINLTLGTELEPGNAILTAVAHRHIAEDHPEEYPIVIAHLPLLIAAPSYIGQSPRHNESFEIVRRLVVGNGQEIVLAGLNMVRNKFGNYNVHSAYALTEEIVTVRIARGHLFFPKKKAP